MYPVQPLTVAGLLLDIAGAIILGYAIFGRSPERALLESQFRYDFNVDLHLSLATQTADAQAGIALLVGGFVMQLVSGLGFSSDSGYVLAAVVAAAIAAIAAVCLALVRWLRPRERKAAFYEQLVAKDPSIWHTIVRHYARELGDPWHGATEPPADVARRLLGERRWKLITEWAKELPPSMTQAYHPDH